jgi:hypothetical protein
MADGAGKIHMHRNKVLRQAIFAVTVVLMVFVFVFLRSQKSTGIEGHEEKEARNAENDRPPHPELSIPTGLPVFEVAPEANQHEPHHQVSELTEVVGVYVPSFSGMNADRQLRGLKWLEQMPGEKMIAHFPSLDPIRDLPEETRRAMAMETISQLVSLLNLHGVDENGFPTEANPESELR